MNQQGCNLFLQGFFTYSNWTKVAAFSVKPIGKFPYKTKL